MTDLTTSAQLFSQAAVLLMVGMGFVFAFLSLLILVIKYIISPLAVHFPDPEPQHKMTNKTKDQPTAVIAAISAAIKQYRNKHN